MPGQQKHTRPKSTICTRGLLYLIIVQEVEEAEEGVPTGNNDKRQAI